MKRDIIVVGASAGGIQAVETLIESLPHDLSAAIFIVVHVPPFEVSILPKIFSRNGSFPVVHAEDRLPIEPRHIYVAPPNFHLILKPDHMCLSRGPREGFHRPAVNALFRSAASVFGPRVIGVVLSGMLDDGTAGLWRIKNSGGIAIVQDPKTATFTNMPMNALGYVDVDYVLPPEEIGPVLMNLTQKGR